MIWNKISTSLALAFLWHQKRTEQNHHLFRTCFPLAPKTCTSILRCPQLTRFQQACEVALKQMPYMQLEMAKAGVNLFVEKPLSVRPAAEVAQLAHELKHIQEQNK